MDHHGNSDPIISQVSIIRVKKNKAISMSDDIIDETILKIIINTEISFEMVFSASYVPELAAGFLFTQGIIQSNRDILDLNWVPDGKSCHITLCSASLKRLALFQKGSLIKGSSGGSLLANPNHEQLSNNGSSPCLKSKQVLELIEAHKRHSTLFHKTGAVHSAGLCTPNGIKAYFEDIGRHNAVDKLAGHILLNALDTRQTVATLSCRMSLEIIGKIIKTRVPVVISNAAPTLSAVRLADESGLTIIGFARDERFNVYTHPHRIALNDCA